VEVLMGGGLILYPTDTIWGIGCDARNEAAVKKVYASKQRNDSKALIVLVNGKSMLEQYTGPLSDAQWKLVIGHPKPVTGVYPCHGGLADALLASDGTVGMRIPRDPFCLELITSFGHPIVSTSANISGALFDGTYAGIDASIVAASDYVVHYRRADLTRREPSSVVRWLSDGTTEFLRN
ncbi:MAG: Sua5/YciO/YrdC/YwlC family protein, partial [Flavobacteriales bacterium]|nr:Sua5/YciO/YrdC/YwlC family protein [Flavobacteriales bacterium]